MRGLDVPEVERWSERVCVIRGLNPGPFTGPGTNTFLVGSGARRLLIDTGSGVTAYLDLLERAIDALPGPTELGDLLLTHTHGDHSGGVAGVIERFGPRTVYRHGPEPGEAARELRDGDCIETEGARLRVLHCPGHAPDHLCFLLEEEHALFTGDVVLGAGTSVIPLEGGDMAAYMDSLRRIGDLDLARIYPGHGPRIDDPGARVRAYLEHRQERERQILRALDAGPSSAAGLVAELYQEIPRSLHAAAAQSVLSHLLKLEREQRAHRPERPSGPPSTDPHAEENWELC